MLLYGMAVSLRACLSWPMLVVLATLLAALPSASALRCYNGYCAVTDSASACQAKLTYPPDISNTGYKCVKYGFICAGSDTACTAAELATGTKKVGYTYVSDSTVAGMKALPTVYTDLLSCSTDGCNSAGATNSATTATAPMVVASALLAAGAAALWVTAI